MSKPSFIARGIRSELLLCSLKNSPVFSGIPHITNYAAYGVLHYRSGVMLRLRPSSPSVKTYTGLISGAHLGQALPSQRSQSHFLQTRGGGAKMNFCSFAGEKRAVSVMKYAGRICRSVTTWVWRFINQCWDGFLHREQLAKYPTANNDRSHWWDSDWQGWSTGKYWN